MTEGAARETPDHPVVVVGSANEDVVVAVERIPSEGETVLGNAVNHLPGGKGLNQACASAASRHNTYFVGSVGEDEAGSRLLAALQSAGVDTRWVRRRADAPSGTAHILVGAGGGNQIVVVPGANGTLGSDEVREALESIPGNLIVVLQGEIPVDCLVEAARFTKLREGRVVLNLAPVIDLPNALLAAADPLVVNEHEVGQMLGTPAPNTVAEAEEAAAELLSRSSSVIVTLGAAGSVVATAGAVTHVPPFDVSAVVDTTGAGDAFVGVLSAQLAEGTHLIAAAETATRAAALSVTRRGASESYSAIREHFASN